MDKGFLGWLAAQGLGVVVGAAMFWLYVKEKRATERRLIDLLRERKTDRDELLRMLGRLDAHLRRDAVLEMLKAEAADSPQRRAADRALLALDSADDAGELPEGDAHGDKLSAGSLATVDGAARAVRPGGTAVDERRRG